MPPLFPNKHTGRPLLTAETLAPTLPTLPPTAMLCYQNSLWRKIGRWPFSRAGRVQGLMGELRRPYGQGMCWLGAFGVGAPATAVAVEQVAARGVQRIVAVGLAGGLTADLSAGSVVLASRALRDEGTSYHYLPAERYAHANAYLTGVLSAALADFAIPNRVGATWTTDAPLRETAEEVAAYTAEGVLTVEMEAATLFAVGQALGVQTAAVLIVSDTLHSGRWQASPPNLSLLRQVWATVATVLALLHEQMPFPKEKT